MEKWESLELRDGEEYPLLAPETVRPHFTHSAARSSSF